MLVTAISERLLRSAHIHVAMGVPSGNAWVDGMRFDAVSVEQSQENRNLQCCVAFGAEKILSRREVVI